MSLIGVVAAIMICIPFWKSKEDTYATGLCAPKMHQVKFGTKTGPPGPTSYTWSIFFTLINGRKFSWLSHGVISPYRGYE